MIRLKTNLVVALRLVDIKYASEHPMHAGFQFEIGLVSMSAHFNGSVVARNQVNCITRRSYYTQCTSFPVICAILLPASLPLLSMVGTNCFY